MSSDLNVLAKKPAFDLTVYHVAYNISDISAYVTWNMHTGEAALVLTPIRRRGIVSFETVIPCIVPQSMAWVWDEEIGDGAHCAQSAMRFANLLNLDTNHQTLFKITAIVRDMIPELINCPPLPDYKRRKVAEMIVTDNQTGKIVEKEVSDHV